MKAPVLPPAPIDDAPAHPSAALDPAAFDFCDRCALQMACSDALSMPETVRLLRELLLRLEEHDETLRTSDSATFDAEMATSRVVSAVRAMRDAVRALTGRRS